LQKENHNSELLSLLEIALIAAIEVKWPHSPDAVAISTAGGAMIVSSCMMNKKGQRIGLCIHLSVDIIMTPPPYQQVSSSSPFNKPLNQPLSHLM